MSYYELTNAINSAANTLARALEAHGEAQIIAAKIEANSQARLARQSPMWPELNTSDD